MFECPFVVGMKVVCIKQDAWLYANTLELANNPSLPRYGDVYEISAIYLRGGIVFLRLLGWRGGYGAVRFRPLAEPNIEVFETLLADVNAGKVKPVVEPADV